MQLIAALGIHPIVAILPHVTTNLSKVGSVTTPNVNAIPLPPCRNKAQSQPFLPHFVVRTSAPPVAVRGNDAS